MELEKSLSLGALGPDLLTMFLHDPQGYRQTQPGLVREIAVPSAPH